MYDNSICFVKLRVFQGEDKRKMLTRRRLIGEMLVSNDVITQGQLDAALEHQEDILRSGEHQLLGSILVDLKILTSKQLLSFINKFSIRLPLGEVLLMEKKIKRKELSAALKLQRKHASEKKDARLGSILVNDLKIINYETLLRCIAKQHNITRIKPDLSEVDPDYFFVFDKAKLLEQRIVPYRKYLTDQNDLTCQVIVSEKDVNRTRFFKKEILDKTRRIFASSNDKKEKQKISIEFAVASCEEIDDFIFDAHAHKEAISFTHKVKIESVEEEEVLRLGKTYYSDNVNVNIFMQILIKAIELKTSDVHIEPMVDRMRVRYRIDGILIPQPDLPKTLNSYFVRGIKNFFRFKDSYARNTVVDEQKRVLYEDKNIELDLRISVIPTIYGDKMVLHLLAQYETVPTFERLGFFKNLVEKYETLCQMSSGMFIVTGPTGSGKTTTLYSTLDYLNDDQINIMTLENPPEYLINGVNQTRVGPEDNGREITYLQGLNTVLRQDPDVIMFGEMYDYESASVALQASLTGHLLFTTMHTNNTTSCITRLADMGIRPFLLSSTLIAILAQRLVRRVCPFCKEEATPQTKDLEFFSLFIKNIEKDIKSNNLKFYQGQGCKRCLNTGFLGRFAVHELLCVNDSVREAILEGLPAKEIESVARKFGMTSLLEDGFLKVLRGLTTLSEVMRVAKIIEMPKEKRTIQDIDYLLAGKLPRKEILAAVFST